MTDSLPDGFRIINVCYGGTGNGDELFTLELQQFTVWTERRGFLRKKRTVSRWLTVERGDPFRSDLENLRRLKHTARLCAVLRDIEAA